MNTPRVLYCGDTSLDSAAAYLAGLMSSWNWQFTYVASAQRLSASNIPADCNLFVFSDYPADCVDSELQTQIAKQVTSGTGLLMIGGWESYHGLGGNWDGTVIGDILPVEISGVDDRQNCDQPVFAQPAHISHPITDGLPWSERPPLIGGFNAFTPKANSQTLLESVRFDAQFASGVPSLTKRSNAPLLTVGTHKGGRTAAFATDVAPHWIGPMVDWGNERVNAQAEGAGDVEVGNLYAAFFKQLLSWTAGLT